MKDLRYTAQFLDALTKKPIPGMKGELLTLQHLLYEAATVGLQGESLDIKEKMQLHTLARKIVDMKPLKAADLLKIKERSGKVHSIPAFGFVAEEIAYTLEEPLDDSTS